jgi:hypothetical protein
MKNIRVQPFLENVYDEKSQHHKSTFYSDIVLQYELLYGVSDSLFVDEIIVGIQFEEEDTEYDIINIINLIMGNPRVRAIVVLDSKIDKNMQRYAVQSTVDDNPDFVLMKEEKYRTRSCYVRFPKQDSLYKALKSSVQKAFVDRMKWHQLHIDTNTEDRCYSAEANIDIIFMDSTGDCTVIFKNPDKLIDVDDRIIRLFFNYNLYLSVTDPSENKVDQKKGIICDNHPWMTDIQKLFANDLNKIIEYRRLKYRRN